MKKSRILLPLRPRKNIEVVYRDNILKLLKPLFLLINNRLAKRLKKLEVEYTADSWDEDVETELDKLRKLWDNNPVRILNVVKRFSKNINNTNKADIERIFNGKGINDLEESILVNALDDKVLDAKIRAKTNENVNLIKTIGNDLLSKVETVIYEGAVSGDRAIDISKEIRRISAVSVGRARFIAIDQLGKFYSAVNTSRMHNLGVTKYIWRNSDDRRVRGNPSGKYPNSRYNHWSRGGKTFSFDKPPQDGNPGEAYGCRCFASPILEF